MRFLKIIFLVSLLSLVNSCATLSRETCMQREWFELGLRDGTNGRAFNRIREHLKACSEYGIQIDREQYSAGREKGLQTYCQLDNAVKTGLEGDLYQSVRPSEIHTPFLRYNQDAYYVYSSKKN